MNNYQYAWNCTSTPGPVELLDEMVDDAIEIKRSYFMKFISAEQLQELFPFYCKRKDQGLTLANDYHVAYFSSYYNGKKCYFITHSCIEYVFTKT